MTRLKPSTAARVERIMDELRDVADDIEDARPMLAPLYRNIADAMDRSLYVKESNFWLKLPEGTYAERPPGAVEIRRDDAAF